MRFHATWSVLVALFLSVAPFPGLSSPGAPKCLAQITVISPNGGEVWTAGTTQTITWGTSVSPSGPMYVYLLRGGIIEEYLGQAEARAWELSWTSCDLIGDGADYTIRVDCPDCSPPMQDDSDGPFTITGSTPIPALTVTSPSGAETWTAGTTHRITWDSINPSGDVEVWLVRPGNPNVFLGEVRTVSGGLTWDIDPFLGNGGDYRVHLSWHHYCGTQVEVDSAGSFAIIGSRPLPALTVTSPNGGEIWPTDSLQSVTWSSINPAGTVEIWLTAGLSYFEYLGSAPTAEGHFDWPILPCNPNGTDYRILVRWSTNDRSVEARSAAPFAVTGSFAPTFTVTSPVVGTMWTAGTSHAITWTSGSTNGDVVVALEGANSAFLGRVPSTAGTLTWDIPSGIGNGTYTIRFWTDTCATQTVSTSFGISGSITPTLTLTSPTGGTNWPAGALRTITWQSVGLTGLLDIYLPDDGLHQSGHVAVPIADGSFTWPIPPTLTWPRDPNSAVVPGGVWLWSYDCGPLKYVLGQAIQVSPGTALLGDIDGDGNVDLNDMAALQAAFTGRGPLFLDSPADFFDFEPDGDVDGDDVDVMAAGMTGP